MKLYIKAVVSLENLKNQFAKDMDDEIFEELIGLDPTANIEKHRGGKYCPWIFKQYNNGNLDIDNQGGTLKDALTTFSRSSKNFKNTDLGKYKTVAEFIEDSHNAGNAGEDENLSEEELYKKTLKEAHAASDKDKKCLAVDGGWELWIPLTYAGSISLARTGGVVAKWCTAYSRDRSWYDKYTRTGPLYIFLNMNKKGEKYQSCPTSTPVCGRPSWFFGIDDYDKGARVFCEFLDKHPIFAKVLKYQKTGEFIKNGRLFKGVSIADVPVEDNGSILADYRKDAEVTIPESIKVLTKLAFEGCSNIQKINIPNTIRSIEDEAFAKCTGLKAITIPDSVTTLGPKVFAECTNLTSVKLSNRLVEIPKYAFSGCIKLQNLTIPTSVKVINSKAFDGCTALSNIDIPDTIKTLASDAFYECDSLSTLDLPDSVTNISNNLFYRCRNLSDIVLPANTQQIGSAAFYKTNITSLDIPSTVTSIGGYAFGYCRNLEEISIPDSVTTLGADMFHGCANLKFIQLPNSVEEIPSSFCAGCTSLEEIDIPNSVTSIGRSAFDGCTALQDITIPESVVRIDKRAFFNCENLTVHIKSAMWDEDFASWGVKVDHS